MRWIWLVLGALLLPQPVKAAERYVSGGRVAGTELSDGSLAFYGVPYAAAPVGNRRWRPPFPVRPWKGVRDASRPGAPCAQPNKDWNEADFRTGREDCLHVSIRTPAGSTGKRLPVFVWIHGGSNSAGSAHRYLEGTIHSEGVVVVSVQYRLGAMGFLGHPHLRAESPHRSSGNYALLDQIAALRWVKQNIAEFGGDPGRVTIAGNSAGATDVLFLTLSPLAQGLFHGAILQSAAPGPPRSAAQNERMGEDLLQRLGLPGGRAGIKALRSLSAATVLDAAEKLSPPDGIDPTFLWEQQVVDGWVLPESYGEAYARARHARVPMIIGNNTRELGMYRPPETASALIADAFGERTAAAMPLYGFRGSSIPPEDPLLGAATTQIITDMWFRCPANWIAQRLISTGQPVWRYQFGVGPPGTGQPVQHTTELDYLFHSNTAASQGPEWPPIMRYWANFVQTGNPNGVSLPPWPATGEEGNYVEFAEDGVSQGVDLRGPACRLMNLGKNHP